MLISDTTISHRSETRGIVITRVQVVEINGERFENRFWSNFETGALHHIDTVAL